MTDWYDWGYPQYPRYPESKPRKAKDGIAARSRKGRIGESWWSGRFARALETAAISTRLSRGRSYARSGQVMDLDIDPGRVTARVQGSRAKPYAVRIDIDRFSDDEWAAVESAMAARAIFLAKLLAGEMPLEIETAFGEVGLSLFPVTRRDLRTDCSCPDIANPCKHIAATFYILAEAFDTDPFLILAWRGRPRTKLLDRLRELRGDAVKGRPAPDHGHPDAPDVPIDDVPPLEASIDHFWSAGPLPPATAPVLDAPPDALLRELGPSTVSVGRVDLADRLADLYARFVARARERLEGDAFTAAPF
jgi:uncharacterized Zn finger protein